MIKLWLGWGFMISVKKGMPEIEWEINNEQARVVVWLWYYGDERERSNY